MIRFIGLLVLAILITSCSDNRNSSSTAVVIEPVKPLAVLAIEQQGDNDGLTSVVLDATKSRHDPSYTAYKFEVRQNQPNRKKLLAGPGRTKKNYYHVLLPKGTYDVTLTVMDSAGEPDSVTETITVEGSESKEWRATQVEWTSDPYYLPGDETETYSRSTGGFPMALAHSLYETQTLGSSGGCGGMLNNAGNGIGIVTGVMGVGIAIAAPELKVAEVGVKKAAGATASAANAAGASTKIAGGNKSGACVQAQIDGINDQLHFQEEQILDLYRIIDRDEELFFKALVDEAGAIEKIENLQFQDALAKFSDPLSPFMQAAALWQNAAPWRVNGEVLELDLLKIAASDSNDAACTVGAVEAASCINVGIGGPISQISQVSLFGNNDLTTVAGLKGFDGCEYDCWQHVGPAAASEATALVDLYKSYAEQLYAEVTLCTSPDTGARKNCRGSENNVVPLFDQYNTAIAMQYLKAVNAVQKGHSIRQLINLYNYNRYVASECSNNPDLTGELTATCLEIQQAASAVSIIQINPGNSIAGTFYNHNGAVCGPEGYAAYAQTPEQNSEAFKCAQQQLGLFYAQVFSVLYTHALNFTITDGPVGSQAYPATSVVFQGQQELDDFNAALQDFNLNLDGQIAEGGETPLGPRFDYEYEIGRSLPDLMGGARTPIDLLANVAGIQTALNGATWTADGALYQAYHISDAAACLQTLLDYNANGQSDVKLEDIYPNYEDCPSIFALHDGTSVANGFYDGITVQPYSFKVSPGGASACPPACNSCQSGFDINDPDSVANWTPGGQGLFTTSSGAKECRGFCSGTATTDVPGNTCGDYDFATPVYTDCTQCSDSANTSDTGSWEGQCNDPVMSGTLGDPNDPPTLQVTGCDPGRYYVKTSTTCESGRWGNNNGSLFCEPALEVGDLAVAVFALSAPMGGNVRQCAVLKIAEVAQAGIEGDTLSCAASVIYGKRFLNSLSENGAFAPGDDTEATFKQIIDSGEYSLWPLLPALDWDSPTGDNGSWSGSCENPTFSGYVGNPSSPPTLEASCSQSDGAKIVSNATCESGHWGNDDGQLFCEGSGTETAFSSDFTCSNDALGGDPAPGYYKQCFCSGGNQLGWLRPESTTDPDALAPELTYLSCGNFAEFNPPRVAWEYEYSGGAQNDADANADDDAPPTYFITNRSKSTPTFEEDIGTKGTTGTGVNYEVAFANVNTDCNAQDNIQLDVVASSGYTCTSPKPYREGLTAAMWIQPVDPVTVPSNCLEFSATSARITNRDNKKSVHYNTIITPKNRLGTGNGPGIPIDLVMQCSDDGDDGNDECDDQSMCMHMVSFKDPEVDTSAEKRAEAMAKRGYICKAITNQRANTRSNENQAVMSCELSDGRKMRLGLNGYIYGLDDRAEMSISISD